ncbi:hypothetical protein VTP01DRAFT_6078 [Rhizomucor pusillus]|uniref:uncharacterized protein n=1 Tax=Rhizomucor pusillus TaxID=4840 RepID=UPI003744747D
MVFDAVHEASYLRGLSRDVSINTAFIKRVLPVLLVAPILQDEAIQVDSSVSNCPEGTNGHGTGGSEVLRPCRWPILELPGSPSLWNAEEQ